MSLCAVCRIPDGLVVNIIVAEPTDVAPYGCFLIPLEEETECSLAWFWDGSQFLNPIPQEPTTE